MNQTMGAQLTFVIVRFCINSHTVNYGLLGYIHYYSIHHLIVCYISTRRTLNPKESVVVLFKCVSL